MATNAIPRIISATDNVPQTKPGENAVGGVGAPPKADAAPKPGATTLGSGLCAALNAYYAEQAKRSGFIPDVYEIKFADPILENASLVPPGDYFDKSLVGGSATATAADQLLSEKQSINTTVRQKSATAGQQIVQFIDTVLRSSSYITAQQKVTWNPDTYTWNDNGPPQRFAWFDISCEAQQLKYDSKQNDFAYKMIYTISPFQTPVISEYFESGEFRGVHKVYNYWFTGQNTQVLQFEQAFNHLWTQAITSDVSIASATQSSQTGQNSESLSKKRPMPASGQARQGGDSKTFEPGANAADYLYSADQADIRLVIVGDPAWIPSPKAMQPGKFVSAPFEADGTINVSASGAYFEFAWNRPRDYDLSTGIMDTGKNNNFADRIQGKPGLAQQTVTYMATTSKSIFRGGKFTQELEGARVENTFSTKAADAGRNTTPPTTTAKTSGIAGIIAATNNVSPVNQIIQSTSKVLQAGSARALQAVTEYTSPAPTPVSITSVSGAQPVPAKPASVDGADIPNTEFQPPPVLSGKPGENRLGGFDLSPNPSQGVVNDDQGT
jgi:hypothetical protein